jgi:hypothetical protein
MTTVGNMKSLRVIDFMIVGMVLVTSRVQVELVGEVLGTELSYLDRLAWANLQMDIPKSSPE